MWYIIKMLRNICIIGAGNIGSRHLQALAKVNQPLSIQVIDPSITSLSNARNRYEEVAKHSKHQVKYLQKHSDIIPPIDIAIIATTSETRAEVTRQLLKRNKVDYIIFEKLLFNKKEDYKKIQNLLKQKGCTAWVNCTMRMISFYSDLKSCFQNQPIQYIVSGGGFGFITSSIHYIDHIVYLTGCHEFEVDTNNLCKKPQKSKRKGFLELTGTLNVYFKDGSIASLSVLPTLDLYLTLEIFSQNYRFIRNEADNKNYYSSSKNNWKWKSESISTLYQSQITNLIVDSILKKGTCLLTPFDISSKMHLSLLEPLQKFLNNNSQTKFDYYPFT